MAFDLPSVYSCLSPIASTPWVEPSSSQHRQDGRSFRCLWFGFASKFKTQHRENRYVPAASGNIDSLVCGPGVNQDAQDQHWSPHRTPGRTDWLIDFPHQHPFPATSHSALERSGVASWWSNHNPALTDSEAHSQERFEAVKMSAWLKTQFERFTAASREPRAASPLLCRLCLRILPTVHNAGMLDIEGGKIGKTHPKAS